MKRGLQGRFIISRTSDEEVRAFVPNPLPPRPPLELHKHAIIEQLERAQLALGRLDGMTRILPDISYFLYLYVRREAVLSSQIEGTQSSLSDLLLYECKEMPTVPLDDVQEVSNYVAALNHGLKSIRGGLPICSRLFKDTHKVLLTKGRGSNKAPGEYRRTQNWIGGTRPGNAVYVPPPHTEVIGLAGDLEKFLNEKQSGLPALVKIALAHVQFETIHPFLDGNGRIGRLLIPLYLCAEGILSEPMLYLSLFFKTHRKLYYELLQTVRTEGDWERWLLFFLEGVELTANQAAQVATVAVKLFERDQKKVETLGRATASALRVHRLLQKKPVMTIASAARDLKMSFPTASAALLRMKKLGMVQEISGRRRNRTFVYAKYLNLLNEGIAPEADRRARS